MASTLQYGVGKVTARLLRMGTETRIVRCGATICPRKHGVVVLVVQPAGEPLPGWLPRADSAGARSFSPEYGQACL